jgi:DNA modification methylase
VTADTELERVLKPTGSIFLHCDPTASHYLKLLLDAVFGPDRFRNEIVWRRTNSRSTGGQFPRIHDTILFYGKSDETKFNEQKVLGEPGKMPHTLVTGSDGFKYQSYELTGPGVTNTGESGRPWRGFDPSEMGRHWGNNHSVMDKWDKQGLIHWPKNGGFPRRRDAAPYDASVGREVTVGDVWTDIDRINQSAKERLGYPTQKPLALLERIIQAASNEGDVVLDPFCGCGTAIEAAQALGRRWIGIDVTKVALEVIEERLSKSFPDLHYTVRFLPTSMEEVDALAARDKYAFQQWVCDRLGIEADIRKGADKGIDGEIVRYMLDGDPWRAVVSVKGGGVNVTQLRDLRGTVERERANVGIFVTYKSPTKPMREEAIAAGLTKQGIPKLQILTAEELLGGQMPVLPVPVSMTMRGPDVVAEPERIEAIGSRRRITA